jgi:tetratricopeptide (TPR) repeat protein
MSEDEIDESRAGLSEFTLDRFMNVRPIGQGRNALVFRAWDRQLEREVAFKTALHEDELLEGVEVEQLEALGLGEDLQEVVDLINADADARDRYSLLREGKLLACIDHPNVVQVLDIGVLDDDEVAVLLPYLDGGTLHGRPLREPWQEVLDIALQIGRGLQAIHAAGLLHRDLKPNNILFGGDGRPRIADLGIACYPSDAEAMADWAGTREYMSPEVLDQKFRDVRDDLYAFCVIMYEMFYGYGPFSSVEARREGRVRAAERQQGMSEALHEIIIRGLAPDADERWPDMPTLLRAMEAVLEPSLPSPRRRWPWVAAAAGVAAAFGMGLFTATQTVQADECEEVIGELDAIWSNEVQAELRGIYGTRKVGDALKRWGARWVEVRAKECEAAKRDERNTEASPCSASTRDRFNATLRALRTPHLREGLNYSRVIAHLPDPAHCLDEPEDGQWGYGGLLELELIDVDVESFVQMGDLELAKTTRQRYMELSVEQNYEWGIARAMFWRGEIRRLEGDLDGAVEDLERAYTRSRELGVPVFEAEIFMKLTAIAGVRGQIDLVDTNALVARAVLEAHESKRLPEVLQVHGLALLSGPEAAQQRGLALLRRAVEIREDQLADNRGSREWVSQAYEDYARGLLAVGRPGEALEYLERALRETQREWGHAAWRVRGILRQKFLALVELGQIADAGYAKRMVLKIDLNEEEWSQHSKDVLWFAEILEDAGHSHAAVVTLRGGRTEAVKHGLLDDITHLDQALARLGAK